MRLGAAVLLVGLAMLTWGVSPGGAGSPPLPLTMTEAAWRPLSQREDQTLEKRLVRALKQNELRRSLMVAGKMAVGLVDLADPQVPRFAQVNGATMMYAASLPKIAILLAVYQGFEDGTLKETPQVRADLIEMIRRSDNAAANRLVARIGLRRLEAVILAPRYRFYDFHRGGGLWMGSAYGPGGEEHPEPLGDLLHAASVTQVCRFYYLLAYGRLINRQRSRQMLKILAFPDLHDKFVSVLEPKVPPWRMYRKSGDYRLWQSDSILVWDETWRRYILVAMVEDRQGEQILRELVPVVEGLLRPKQP
jgi:beta-lactamase class A